jgi:hypothetical protein
LPISRLIHRRSFLSLLTKEKLLQWERIESSTFNGIIMRRFGKTLRESARRSSCLDIHALVILWAAFLVCRSGSALGGDAEGLSNTSSEDRFWDLTRVCMLVQRAFWKPVQQHWYSTWIWTALGNIMSIPVPATLVV